MTGIPTAQMATWVVYYRKTVHMPYAVYGYYTDEDEAVAMTRELREQPWQGSWAYMEKSK